MTSTCPHLSELSTLKPPRFGQAVHREECTQCFDNQDQGLGIDVCLSCFNGACIDISRHHAVTHRQKSGHAFTLNVKRKLKASSSRTESEEPPQKITKLAIVEDREEDKYEHVTLLKCWKCDSTHGLDLPEASADPKVQALVDGVMQSMSSARQSEVKAWEEVIIPCEHTLLLEQSGARHIPASGLAHCQKCDLKENLWLCMTCGSLGCGRQQAGGLKGNGHALQHYTESKHPFCVKLGTITPEGLADTYCYACDDAKIDPNLAMHLSTFGINVRTQTKTEKSITELQIEQNLTFDFSLTGEDGKALEPVFGPGVTGLKNLGNSCYMASIIQVLFALPGFQRRYQPQEIPKEHWTTCPELLPADCLDCQMYKLADGLLSGRYSRPPANKLSDSSNMVFQEGIKPSGFKALIGKGHAEFSTMKQQDSEEFFTYLITSLRRHSKKVSATTTQPSESFAFGMEQRLQCGECKGVRYRVDPMDVVGVSVPARELGKDEDGKVKWAEATLEECLDGLTGLEALEYACPACKKNVIATKQARFSTFPDVLVIHAKKFQLVNWVPTKLDIPLILPASDDLVMDRFIGHGRQENEVELPDDIADVPTFNEAAMAQLEGMGFPVIRCQKALMATGNSDPEAAMEWLFAHMDDPDIDMPITTHSLDPELSAESISMLVDMGFSDVHAKKALHETYGNLDRAVEWLFSHPDQGNETTRIPSSSPAVPPAPPVGGSTALPARYKLKAFVSHKGPSTHSGHYVAHIRLGDEWLLFNDEKVVKADKEGVKELRKLAYLYFFESV